jgi:hypothetical protein
MKPGRSGELSEQFLEGHELTGGLRLELRVLGSELAVVVIELLDDVQQARDQRDHDDHVEDVGEGEDEGHGCLLC